MEPCKKTFKSPSSAEFMEVFLRLQRFGKVMDKVVYVNETKPTA